MPRLLWRVRALALAPLALACAPGGVWCQGGSAASYCTPDAALCLSWTLSADAGGPADVAAHVTFTLSAALPSTGYASVGFSDTYGRMSPADVYATWLGADGRAVLSQRRNVAGWAPPALTPSGSASAVLAGVAVRAGGRTNVTFSRPLATSHAAWEAQLAAGAAVNLIWATGGPAPATAAGPLPQHTASGAARLLLVCADGGLDANACAHVLAPPAAPRVPAPHAVALAWALAVLVAGVSLSRAAHRCPGGAADCALHCAPLAVPLARAPTWLRPLAAASAAELALGLSLAGAAAGVAAGGARADAQGVAGPALGVTTAFLLGVTLLPVTRHSAWLPLLRVSVERALRFHAAAARLLLLLLVAHVAAVVAARVDAERAADANASAARVAASLLTSATPTRGGAGAAYGTAAACCLVATALAAMTLRRARWAAFKAVHLLLFPPAVILAILHARVALPYTLPGLGLWAVDRVVRLYGSGAEVRVLSLRPLPCGATLVELDNSQRRLRVGPAQYVQLRFLRSPALATAETHPYSLACAPGKNGEPPPVLTLLVAAARHGSAKEAQQPRAAALAPRLAAFAAAAAARVAQATASADAADVAAAAAAALGGLTAAVEGPYGCLALRAPRRYAAVVLIAGGAGVAPMASLAAYLLSQEEEEGDGADAADAAAAAAAAADVAGAPRTRVTFVWAARDADALCGWAPGLLAGLAAHPRATPRLFCTGSMGDGHNGRTEDGVELGHVSGGGGGGTDDDESAADVAVAPGGIRIERGRPDVDALVAAAGAGHAAADVAVAVCGPPPLAAAAHAAARRRRYHFHGETFQL